MCNIYTKRCAKRVIYFDQILFRNVSIFMHEYETLDVCMHIDEVEYKKLQFHSIYFLSCSLNGPYFLHVFMRDLGFMS